MLLTLGLANWAVGLLIAAFLFVCVILVLTVLIQRPQGGGLSGAFGSNSGSGQTAFGAKTGDALTIATIGMFVIYVLGAIGLNYAVRPQVAPPPTPPAATGSGSPEAPVDGAALPAGTPTTAPTPAAADQPATPVEGGMPSGTPAGESIVPIPINPPPASGEGGNQPPTPPAPAPAEGGSSPTNPTPGGEPPASPAPAPAPSTPPGSPPPASGD